ncbi:MAG: glycosyltransferase family 4 protein [Sphingomonadales bacterium]|nr:glycosyltransferase family 4 protein [Sphingomonadales bacterium]
MRILSVSNFFDTHGGGLERVAGHLAREFALTGYDSSWAASDADGLPQSPARAIGLNCLNPTEALTGLPMPLPTPRAIGRLARAIGASDVVVIHDALYVTSIIAMALAKLRRKPVVLIQHIAAIPFASAAMRALMRTANALVTRPMLAAADRLVFISAVVREDLLGPDPKRASLLLFNGVDQAIFHTAAAQDRQAIRARWNLPVDGPLAIFVGRFVEKKGLAVLRSLAADRPDMCFALVGQGPIRPDDWGLQNVRVLGQQEQAAVADLFRAGDALVLPSVGEGYPLVIQEAMACGLPVVCGEPSARSDPQAAQWLSGVEIDLADPIASARRCGHALDDLLRMPSDRHAMASYAAATYNWSRMAARLLDGLFDRTGARTLPGSGIACEQHG